MAERAGHLLSVTLTPLSATVVTGSAIGDTVLFVDDVADFDESGGWLSLNGASLQYDSTDDDAATITLTATLTAAVSPDDVVYVLNHEAGMVQNLGTAAVQLPEGPVLATIPVQFQTFLSDGMRDGEHEAVMVDHPEGNPDSWEIVGIPGKESGITMTWSTGSGGGAVIEFATVPVELLPYISSDPTLLMVSAGEDAGAAIPMTLRASAVTVYDFAAGAYAPVYASNTTTPSDRSIKQKFADPGDALSMIRSLPVYAYELKSDPGEQRFGVMADDATGAVAATMPDGIKGINLYDLLALTLAGLQQLDAQVNPKATRKARNLKEKP